MRKEIEMAQAQQNQAIQTKEKDDEMAKLARSLTKILTGIDDLQEQIDEIKKSLWGDRPESSTGKIPELEAKVEKISSLPVEIATAKKDMESKVTETVNKVPDQVKQAVGAKAKALEDRLAKIETHLGSFKP